MNSASTTSSGSAATKKSKLGLGAAKAKSLDFEEAERKAKEEEERIKQLGYDRRREEEEVKARKEAEALKKANEIGPLKSSTNMSVLNSGTKESFNTAQKSPAFPRLGFGAIPGAGAAAAVAASAVPTNRHVIYFLFAVILIVIYIALPLSLMMRRPPLEIGSVTRKLSRPTCTLAGTPMILPQLMRLKRGSNPSRALPQYHQINTLGVKRKKSSTAEQMEGYWEMVVYLVSRSPRKMLFRG